MAATGKTLRRILSERILIIAGVALILQFAYILYQYGKNSGDLAEAAIETELDNLSAALISHPANFAPPRTLAERYAKYPANYGFEIRSAGDHMLASANPGLFADVNRQAPAGGREVTVRDMVGSSQRIFESRTVNVEGVSYAVSAASIGDPAGLMQSALVKEVADHVILPIVPLTLLFLLALWLVLKRSLAPVEAAAMAVANVDRSRGGVRLDLDAAPLEIAALSQAVNKLLDDLEASVKSHHDFAANVAHELRTPLSLIMLELEGSQDASAQRVRAEAASMSRLTGQLLSISRLEGLDRSTFTSVDLAALARSVVEQLAPAALKFGVELEVESRANVAVRAQAEAIESALRNLVENAVRVAPSGTAVNISVGPGPKLSVTDRGPGIAEERLKSLFARYCQGDRRTRGNSGLGLEITKRTIELHGGRVEVETELGSGSTFSLVFPA